MASLTASNERRTGPAAPEGLADSGDADTGDEREERALAQRRETLRRAKALRERVAKG